MTAASGSGSSSSRSSSTLRVLTSPMMKARVLCHLLLPLIQTLCPFIPTLPLTQPHRNHANTPPLQSNLCKTNE